MFKAKERMIEISIEKDHLFDEKFEIVRNLYCVTRDLRILRKKYSSLKKLHSNCKSTVILYR